MILNTIMRIWHRFRANFFPWRILSHPYFYQSNVQPLWLSKFLKRHRYQSFAIFAVVGLSAAVLTLSRRRTHLANLGIKSYGDLDIIFAVIIVAAIFAQLLYSVNNVLTGQHHARQPPGTNRSPATPCPLRSHTSTYVGKHILVGCILLWSCFDQSIKPIIFGGAEPGSESHENLPQDA